MKIHFFKKVLNDFAIAILLTTSFQLEYGMMCTCVDMHYGAEIEDNKKFKRPNYSLVRSASTGNVQSNNIQYKVSEKYTYLIMNYANGT